MPSSAARAIAAIGVVLFGLWGCAGTETKQTQAENEPAQSVAAAEKDASKQAAAAPEAAPEVSKELTVPSAPEAEAKTVEVIPAQAAKVEPIEAQPMPAPEQDEAAQAEAAPAVSAVAPMPEEPAKVAAPVAAGPNTFVITVGKKSPQHPYVGKGHAMGFMVDGVSGKSLVLERGKTYRFVVQTNPKHDLYISSKAIGWGSAPVVEGVENAFIYNGTMTFTPDKNTPDKVYYACRNHPYMGATLYIVNPGETVEIEQKAAAGGAAAATDFKAATVSEAQVKQKLMFAEMMMNGQGAKRVLASQNAQAKQLLATAKQNIAASREKLLGGALADALNLADKSLKQVSEASQLVPSEEQIAQHRIRYEELLKEIADFESSYDSNFKRMSKAGSVPAEAKYDQALVAQKKSEAAALAAKNDYVKANEALQEAQHLVTMALHKMLDSQTIVYDLKFDSPAEEFDYELKRYKGYEDLIPVAIEMKKPAPGAIKLMESFLEKAQKRRDEAKQKAAENEYSEAIGMIQQATTMVRRALRMVGVTQ